MADSFPATETPTRIRWFVLAVATLSSLLLYLDRICVSFAVESIRVEFNTTQQQMSWFLGAFFWSYALGQVPAGWLSDRFGTRTMLTWYILLWSAFTALLGLSTGIGALLGFRFGCGLAQAGAYPSCGKAVRDWMPLMQRGMASSVIAFGGRIGGAIAPLLTGAVMLWLALSGRDARFTPEEILEPQRVAEQLLPLNEPPATWILPLRRAAFDNDSSTTLQWNLWHPHSDGDAQKSAAQILNETEPLAIFAAVDDLDSLQLPPELKRRVAQYRNSSTSQSADSTALANRQFWEVALPGAVKKLESRGWRTTLVIYGSVGIFVAALFWIVFRNEPETHPWVNEAEVRLIGNVPRAGASSASAQEPFPGLQMLTDIGLWGNCLCQFGTNIGWLFLVTWFPRYLDEVHKVPVLERGVMASVPIFAGMIGMLAGGPWTDRLTAKYGLRWGRRIPIASSRVMAAFGYVVTGLAATGWFGELTSRGPAWIAVAGLAIVAITTDLGVPATWAYAQDIAGKHTAAVLGWGNMWGNLGAAVAPLLYNLFLGEEATLTDWRLLFGFCGGAFLVSAIGGCLMDSSRPLIPLHEPEA